ncbi:MAG: hypothetical protein ABW321_34995 [Polyangiales bacterium]
MISIDELSDPGIDALTDESGQRSLACGNVVVFYSPADPSRRYLQRCVAALTRLATRHPAGLGMMVMVPELAPPPREDTREALQESYRSLARMLLGTVLVFEGSGFVASVKRSAATLLSMRLAVPVKVAADAQEGAGKLIKLLGPALDPRVSAQRLVDTAGFTRKTRPS